MRRLDRGRLSSAAAVVVALAAAIVLAGILPGTSGAFTADITNTQDTAASKARFVCGDLFAADARRSRAYFEYTFRESATATAAADSSTAGDTGTYEGAHAKDTAAPAACPADTGSAYLLNGSTSRVTTSVAYPPIRHNFSVEVWFKTTATSVKILGFEREQSGVSANYDKHLYVDSAGDLRYAIYDGNTNTIVTPGRVNDGVWHHAVGTTSDAAGSVLYLDGVQVGSDPLKTTAEDFPGYWRIGEGKTAAWPGAPDLSHFSGSLAFAAAYAFVLTPAEIRAEYDIGRPG